MSMFGGSAGSSDYKPAEAPSAPTRYDNKTVKTANKKRRFLYRRSNSTTGNLLTGTGAGGPPRSYSSQLLGAQTS